MKGIRRSRYDIIVTILETVIEEANITKIVYKSNINFKMAKKYIDFLIEKELIKILSRNGKRVYKITDKGKSFLKKFNELKDIK